MLNLTHGPGSLLYEPASEIRAHSKILLVWPYWLLAYVWESQQSFNWTGLVWNGMHIISQGQTGRRKDVIQ